MKDKTGFSRNHCCCYFIASVALIIIGQKNIGPQGLLTMLAGLAGLIGLLAFIIININSKI